MANDAHYQKLIDRLNVTSAATLPRQLVLEDAVFGDPQPFGGNPEVANTKIPFGTNSPDVFGAGSIMIPYIREDVGQVIPVLQAPLDPSVTQMSDIVDRLNSDYGLSLVAEDYYDDPIDQSGAPGTQTTVTLRIKSTSVFYIGQALMQFQVAASDAVATTQMDGLNGPA